MASRSIASYKVSCISYGHLDAAKDLTRVCCITQLLDSIDPVFGQITHTVQFNGGQYKEILKLPENTKPFNQSGALHQSRIVTSNKVTSYLFKK